MKIVAQRCSYGAVLIDGQIISEITNGFCLLCGFTSQDTEADLDYMAHKIAHIRVFSDRNGKLNYDIRQTSGQILAVSQFTLCADIKKGYRPSFTEAMPMIEAQNMFTLFCLKLREQHLTVKEGVFGSHMDIHIHNDGPVTITLDSSPVLRTVQPIDKKE